MDILELLYDNKVQEHETKVGNGVTVHDQFQESVVESLFSLAETLQNEE